MTSRASPLPNGLQGVLLTPDLPTGLGVVVLGGSSGRVDIDRARLFAERGAYAIALQWFGGAGQAPAVCEIPLETFLPATEALVERGCDRIAYVGTSKGAEAALLVAAHDARVDVVVACSPTSLVWAQTGPGLDGKEHPQRSSFMLAGRPFPFVAYDEGALGALSRTPPIAYLDLHLKSLAAAGPEVIEAATIPLERSKAHIVLVAGGDDALYPSERFAVEIATRRKAAGQPVTLVRRADAGHRILFPGETTPRSILNVHGGTDAADRALGAEAWPAITEVLNLRA